MGIAGDLPGAHVVELALHLHLRILGGFEQHHAVVLDHEPRQIAGAVRHELAGRKRLDLLQQRLGNALRPGHRLVVEEMAHLSGRRLPADVAHLPRLPAPLIVAVCLGRVVVMAGFGPPRTDDMRVEGPVGNVDAVHAIDERPPPERVRRQPLRAVPPADLLAHLDVGDLERQQALRPDRRLDLIVGHQRRRAAEVAVLPDALGIEDRHCLAALTLHRPLLHHPAAVFIRDVAKRRREIELPDLTGRVDGERGDGPAESTDQRLSGRIPFGLRAAGGTGIFMESGDVGHSGFSLIAENVTATREKGEGIRENLRFRFHSVRSPFSLLPSPLTAGLSSAC